MFVGLLNFKKGFYLFLFFRIVLVTNIALIVVPGVPLLTLEVCMTMFYLGVFFHQKNSLCLEIDEFPYKNPFRLLAISYLLSTIFAYAGFTAAFSAYIGQMISELAFTWLMWKIIDRRDVVYLVMGFSLVFLMTCFYGFYEKSTLSNPLMVYEQSLMGSSDRVIDFTSEGDEFRGYRVQSFFESAIGAGINWGMYIIYSLSLLFWYQLNIKKTNKVILLIVSACCIPCVFFVNTRSAILFLLIGVLSFINLKDSRFYLRILAIVILIPIIAPFFSDYTDNILSLFDSKAQAKVGGSNAQMRFEQLSAALTVMSESPIIGLGYKFMYYLKTSAVEALLGLESMWFQILTQFGILGALANIYLAYYSLVKVPRHFKSQPLFFFSLSYWVTASLTSVPGMKMYFYYFIMIVFIKLSNVYQEEENYYNYD